MLTLIIVLIAVAVVVLVSAGFVVTGRRRALRPPERPVVPPVPPPARAPAPAPVAPADVVAAPPEVDAAPPEVVAEPTEPEAPEAPEAPLEPPRMRDRLGRARNLFAGYLTTMNQATNKITGTYAISDGSHSKLLFADNNTLWIGSQYCATGEREKQFAAGVTTQAANYNCLTMVDLGGATLSPQIIPAVNQAGTGVTAVTVGYPNQNENPYYYGSLTGICWVQGFNKVYTAYGGQVHIFSTVDGSEIDNQYVIIQGTALDVAYLDAQSDAAN